MMDNFLNVSCFMKDERKKNIFIIFYKFLIDFIKKSFYYIL